VPRTNAGLWDKTALRLFEGDCDVEGGNEGDREKK
jgi:hypothetical protein